MLRKHEAEEHVLSMREYFALLHRLNGKEILRECIKTSQILLRILARLNEGNDFKLSYMMPVAEYEKEEEVMPNRIRLRKYLRELFVNRIRLLDQDYANFKKLMDKGDDGGF